MDLITQIITVLFVIIVFYGVLVGLIAIAGISIVGLVKGLHNKNPLTVITSVIVITILYTGTNTIAQRIRDESTATEVNNAVKEEYIHNRLFPEDNVAIERVPREDKFREDYDQYYVITEEDNIIYVVTLYPEEAFGLMRYKVEYFNEDERLE